MASGGTFNHAGINAFDSDLIGVYKLDRIAGSTRINSSQNAGAPGGLSEVNGPIASVAGQDNNAADIEASSSQVLEAGAGEDFAAGQQIITVAVWIKVESLGTNRTVVSEDGGSGNNPKFNLQIRSNGAVRLQIRQTQGGSTTNLDTDPGKVTAGSWFFIGAVMNATTDQWTVQVNGTKERDKSSVVTTGPHSDASDKGVMVGAQYGGTYGTLFDGGS